MLRLVAVALLSWVWSGTVGAEELTGIATVVDGDTVELHGEWLRLHGIDAPESRQRCFNAGASWRCGQKAALALADRIGRSPITCTFRARDRYGRGIAVCRLRDQDLNEWMVRAGWALAYRRYSKDYVSAEDEARAARRGMWEGRFVEPWKWRRGERLEPQ